MAKPQRQEVCAYIPTGIYSCFFPIRIYEFARFNAIGNKRHVNASLENNVRADLCHASYDMAHTRKVYSTCKFINKTRYITDLSHSYLLQLLKLTQLITSYQLPITDIFAWGGGDGEVSLPEKRLIVDCYGTKLQDLFFSTRGGYA